MTTATKNKYFEAVGRRKTAVARVRIFKDSKNSFVINEKEMESYFPTEELQSIAREALLKGSPNEKFSVSVLLGGGGQKSQAEAMRHGISRALVSFDENLRPTLKKAGFLKRDPRMKERKKFGLKKARKAPQWSKR